MKNILFLLSVFCFWVQAYADPIELPADGGTQSIEYVEGTTYYWYKYTAKENVMLRLLYCGEASNVSFYAQYNLDSDYPDIYGYDRCEWSTSKGSGIRLQLLKDEVIYIKVYTLASIDFEATVLKNITLGGESCDNPIQLKTGSNYFPLNKDKKSWYTYTAEADARLVFDGGGETFSLYRYESCASTTSKSYFSTDGIIEITVKKGDVLLLQCSNMTPLVIELSVEEPKYMPSLPVDGGEVHVEYVEGQSEYWYKYEGTDNTFLKIFYCGTEKVELTAQNLPEGFPDYYADLHCNKEDQTGTGIRLQMLIGETLYIKIKTETSIDLDVEVKKGIPVEGKTCSEPLILQDGYNYLPVHKQGYQYETWLSYTSDKEEIISIDSNDFLTFYRYNTCSDDNYSEYYYPTGDNNTINIELKKDETLLLKSSNSKPAEVTLSSSPIAPQDGGESCANPLTAVKGTNKYQSKYPETWYAYTATQTGNIIIRTSEKSDFSGYLYLYADCSTWKTLVQQDENGLFYLKAQVEANTPYYIMWKNYATTECSFDFTIEESEIEQGSTRNNPLPANIGENAVPYADARTGEFWFKYTATNNGWLNVFIRNPQWNPENGTVVFYQSENPNIYDFEKSVRDSLPDNQGYRTSIIATKGVSYLINLNTIERMNDLKFELTETDLVQGDLCSMSYELEGTSATLKRWAGTEWYHWVAPQTGNYQVISRNLSHWDGITGNSDILVKVGDCESKEFKATYSQISNTFVTEFSAEADEDIYIGIYVKVCKPDVKFEINYITPDHIKDTSNEMLKIYPNPSAGEITITYSDAYIKYPLTIEITDLEGKLVYGTTGNGQKVQQLSLNHLSPGTYFIKLYNKESITVEKIILK